MRVEQILNAIANYCQDEQLIFQVIVRDTEAHVYINRQTEAEIDHFELKDNIVTAVCDLSNLNLDELYLYSRVAGIEPDWQTSINLTSTDLDEAVSDRDNNLESKVDRHSNITQADADASDLLGDRDEENEREIGDREVIQVSNDNNDSAGTQIDIADYCFIDVLNRNHRIVNHRRIDTKKL